MLDTATFTADKIFMSIIKVYSSKLGLLYLGKKETVEGGGGRGGARGVGGGLLGKIRDVWWVAQKLKPFDV